MSIEAVKYNPVNITPEHLFRPPTFKTHPELAYLISGMTKALEGSGIFKGDRTLRVGAEFEVFFFSPEGDPALMLKQFGESNTNPNYSSRHWSKMDKMYDFSARLSREKPDEYLHPSKGGRIFFEFRTAPQSVSDHLATVDRFGDMLRDKCRELEVLPVVHSQHLHVSLKNNPLKRIHRHTTDNEGGFVPRGIKQIGDDLFYDVYPLVLLPEEWYRRTYSTSHSLKTKNGRGGTNSGYHPEFRKLSSEYANDPLLNLVLSLRAMERGCFHGEKLKKDKEPKTFEVAVEQMAMNKELAKFFGRSTLDTLSGIVAQYPAVSRREITVDQIK